MFKAGASTAILSLFLTGCAQSGTSHFSLSDYRPAFTKFAHESSEEGTSVRSLVSIKRGDTLLGIIDDLGGDSEFYYAMNQNQQSRLSRITPGDMLEIIVDQGKVLRLSKKLPSGKWLSATRIDDAVFMIEQNMISEYRESMVAGRIGFDLRGDLLRIGLPHELTDTVLDIMLPRVDIRDTYRPGDSIRVIYQQAMLDGKEAGAPQVKSIQYIAQGNSHYAFRHQADSGLESYYDEQGKSLGSSWLREPIKSYTRISSHFNPNRRHPVTGRYRPHNGVDFSAPTGTEIYAASDGVVDVAGRNGGLGIYVAIQHANAIETRYAHMSRLGTARAGDRVKKGDLIGYVGSTGISTGPHLHYEMWVNGVARDPMKDGYQLAQSGTLKGGELERFQVIRDRVMALMESGKTYVVKIKDPKSWG